MATENTLLRLGFSPFILGFLPFPFAVLNFPVLRFKLTFSLTDVKKLVPAASASHLFHLAHQRMHALLCHGHEWEPYFPAAKSL